MSTNISWTDETWSPVTGCTRVSDGCLNCYIERTPPFRMSGRRFDLPMVGGTTGVQLHPERLGKPLHWRKPRKVFVCSMADLFHEQVPDEHIAKVFATMAATPQHTYQVLTKRHARMRALLSRVAFAHQVLEWGRATMRARDSSPRAIVQVWPLPNVWLGVSVENQQCADMRIPALLDTPAAMRFLSCEPLLGPVDLLEPRYLRPARCSQCGGEWSDSACGPTHALLSVDRGIGWVIGGGESGPPAEGGPDIRPMHPDWARSLRDQCQAANVPFHFKQWGEWLPLRGHREHLDLPAAKSNRNWSRPFGDDVTMCRVGKKAAGRLLDGRTWDEFPAHQHYVEPFAGSLSVLLAKPPAAHETVNDIDGDLMTFWRVLRDRPAELERACQLTPHSRAEHAAAREWLNAPACDRLALPDLEVARLVWVMLSQGRSGVLRRTGWKFYIQPSASPSTGMPGYLDGYVGRMPTIGERLHGVSLECRPALEVIRAYDRPGVLLYVDPPYLGSARSDNPRQYRHEMHREDEHRELAEALSACTAAAVVLSGYPSALYDELYAAWHVTRLSAATGQGGTWSERTEVLWSNREPVPNLFTESVSTPSTPGSGG